jgi:hypothetical protein
MMRKSKRLERLAQTQDGRAFLNGFMIGFVFGLDEARKEWSTFGDEIEEKVDAVRAEYARAIAQLRQEWGLPEHPDPDRPPVRAN